MRTVFLALALFFALPTAVYAEAHDHDTEVSAEHHCDCPPECECHQPGGTCPDEHCSEECNCHKFHGYFEPFIHESMQEAIKKNETELVNKFASGSGELAEDIVNGYHTGFKPTSDFYRGAKYLNVKADPELIAKYSAKGLDHRDFSYSPVRGQIQGSCWAEATVSVHELNWNAMIPGSKLVFAVNDVIDCSGHGSARGGGQLAFDYSIAGLAFNSDYPYTGRDGRCKRDIERHNPLEQVAIVRGENGRFPNEAELLTAYFKYGALGVCGSAGALGRGGRQDEPRGGSTNHCYAYAAARPGKSLGWLDAWYHSMKNSWGDGSDSEHNLSNGDWGDKGYGHYRLSRDGNKISGSVVTEVMIAFSGERRPAEPVTFFLENSNWKLKVTIAPAAEFTPERAQRLLKLALESAGPSVESAKPAIELAVKTLETEKGV